MNPSKLVKLYFFFSPFCLAKLFDGAGLRKTAAMQIYTKPRNCQVLNDVTYHALGLLPNMD